MNFAIGSVRLAPNKKLNNFLKIKYKFSGGINQLEHLVELIEKLHDSSFELWYRKLIDIKVKAHLQILVVITNGLVSLYAFNSELISLQNQTDNVIKIVEILIIKSARLYLPMKRIRLMKNNIDIFQ